MRARARVCVCVCVCVRARACVPVCNIYVHVGTRVLTTIVSILVYP